MRSHIFFSLDIWFSASARADYKMLLINQAIMMGIVPKLVTQLAVATVLFEAMHLWFNGRILLWTEATGWFIAAFFTVSLFLMDDVTKYFVHRALHRWRFVMALSPGASLRRDTYSVDRVPHSPYRGLSSP